MAISPVSLDKISSVTPTPATSQVNSNSRNIQTEIVNKQQHLKRISSDTTITATEREEKRRELQKEIDELNRKLQQEKLEQKEEAEEAAKKQEAKAARKADILASATSSKKIKDDSSGVKPTKSDFNTAKEDTTASTVNENQSEHHDMSVQDIQQMLSADYLVQKERIQEQVDLKKESTVNILQSEIRQDKIYGADTSQKEAELETLQQKQNFWSDAQKQKQTDHQVQAQAVNANAKVVIDQI